MSDTAVDKRSVISRTTFAVAGALAALLALFYLLDLQLYVETLSDAAYTAVYVYGIALQPLIAGIILWVAFSFAPGESVRRQWMLIGIAVTMFAIGDVIWMVLELFMGLDPYPSIADIFYSLEYVFFVAAVAFAVKAYSGLVKTRIPLVIGGVVGVVAVAIQYVALLRPYIWAADSGLDGLGVFVSTLYPVGDAIFMIAPAVTLALVIRQLGQGRFVWPWWFVAAGAVVFGLADSWYSYADWAGTGLTAAMDLGWLAANALFAVGALVARDVFKRT